MTSAPILALPLLPRPRFACLDGVPILTARNGVSFGNRPPRAGSDHG